MSGAVAPLLINQASAGERFRDHPGLKLHGVESYIAVPLRRRDGRSFGTLCALDTRPAGPTEESLNIFRLLAELIAFELEADDDTQQRAAELEQTRRGAELRERFIGILGHDLRGPLNAIRMAARRLMMSRGLPEDQSGLVKKIVTGVDRMNRLIGDLLDFGYNRDTCKNRTWRLTTALFGSPRLEQRDQRPLGFRKQRLNSGLVRVTG